MRRTPDAIYAIRALLGGDSPDLHQYFALFGRKALREAMAASMLCHHDVVDASIYCSTVQSLSSFAELVTIVRC